MTLATRLFTEAEARTKRRRAARNRMADDILAMRTLEDALRRFDLFAPVETKTERFTLGLGFACLAGCAVFGLVYL